MFDFEPLHASQALSVVQSLQSAGFIAYFAGGCVRDALLGIPPKDFDVATDAVPDKVREIFGKRRTLAFGASFGVIGVLGQAELPTEVATFRSDGEYSDGRRPDSVRFGNAEHDAMRRDFTINGIFYDPVAAKLIDFVGGEHDLKHGIVRAIGDPAKRIGEDKLRMLRAIRFAASLGFSIEPATLEATKRFASDVVVVSGERIGAEMRRMLSSKGAPAAFEWLMQTELMNHIWPSIASAEDSEQFIVNAKRVLESIEPKSFVAAVACLIATSNVSQESSIREVTGRWKLSCEEQRAITESCRHHQTILKANQLPWSVIQPLLASRDAEVIVSTANAIGIATGQSLQGVQFCQSRLMWPRELIDPAPLMTGDTLREMGFKPGPKFRDVLQAIRNQQLDKIIESQDQAVQLATKMLQ